MMDFQTAGAAERCRRLESYLERQQLYPLQIDVDPSPELGLAVVIPCRDEPDVLETLRSLSCCRKPGCDVVILVVVNAPESADESVRVRNEETERRIREWISEGLPGWLACHVLSYPDLPARTAGVGLARKLGMDEAVSRFAATESADGIIASLDADCSVDGGYLCAIHEFFQEHAASPGASIYFEHPLADPPEQLDIAMAEYELHMRCYVAGQVWADFPYGVHTLGSALAVRAGAYAAQGGMNRRQGGEDFYFIQKLLGLGGYGQLTGTTVYPGVRLSNRVPFGTGPALRQRIDSGEPLMSYDVRTYEDLQSFCEAAVALYETDAVMDGAWSPSLQSFLECQQFRGVVAEIRSNVAGPNAFFKRLFRWFNGYRFLKYAQHAARDHYPRVPVATAAAELMRRIEDGPEPEQNPATLLKWFRARDRNPPAPLVRMTPTMDRRNKPGTWHAGPRR